MLYCVSNEWFYFTHVAVEANFQPLSQSVIQFTFTCVLNCYQMRAMRTVCKRIYAIKWQMMLENEVVNTVQMRVCNSFVFETIAIKRLGIVVAAAAAAINVATD